MLRRPGISKPKLPPGHFLADLVALLRGPFGILELSSRRGALARPFRHLGSLSSRRGTLARPFDILELSSRRGTLARPFYILFYSTSLFHRCYQLARLGTDNKNEGR